MSDFSLVKPGILTVSAIDNFAPLIFRDPVLAWQGFEVDILEAFAAKFKLKLNFQLTPFDGIWQKPCLGESDIAAAGISISRIRCDEGAAFTEPYLFMQQSLLVKKTEQAELKNLAGAHYIEQAAPKSRLIQEFNHSYQPRQYSEYSLTSCDETDEKFALVVAPNQQILLAALNQHIQQLKANGKLTSLYKKWCET